MKIIVCLSIIFLLTFNLSAMDKSFFDLDSTGLHKSTGRLNPVSFGSHLLRKNVSEISLISGGYFTIGTNQGVSDSPLDDRCEITFGHPFAMTSFPIFSIDGLWYRTEEYISDLSLLSPSLRSDSLVMHAEKDGIVIDFNLHPRQEGEAITLSFSIKNVGSVPHQLGAGLVFDPALGHWGDGVLYMASEPIKCDTVLTGEAVPLNLDIRERSSTAYGLCTEMSFEEQKPDKIIVANWPNIYRTLGAEISMNRPNKLYDLALELIWNETTIQPGQVKAYIVTIHLKQPDFSSPVFMRWDMPTALSLENNLLFPRSLQTYLQLHSPSGSGISNAILKVDSPKKLLSPSEQYAVNFADSMAYMKLPFQSKEALEDQIVTINLYLEKDHRAIDVLQRNIFIPGIPLSDTGLVVNIDTVDVSAFPQVNLKFESRVERTQQLITHLEAENIFLYENDSRVLRFSLTKDTTGGIRAADIVFVLDVTGSMGNEIDKVKNNIIEFADSLEYRGVDYRLGMVTFLDVIENIYPFTTDVQDFRNLVAQQHAHGGGDRPENSLEALYQASQMTFRPSAKRIVIWITDADYHEQDGVTRRSKQEVINALLSQDITVHAIGSKQFKSGSYDPIIIATGGNYYDINGNFRDILLDISRLKASGKYLISYKSANTGQGINTIRLELHFAGLGGSASVQYQPNPTFTNTSRPLTCFPNPFNPVVRIHIQKPEDTKGEVNIYNLLGQKVKHFNLSRESSRQFTWNARDEQGLPVGSGFYLVQLSFVDQKGKIHRQVEKILYLK